MFKENNKTFDVGQGRIEMVVSLDMTWPWLFPVFNPAWRVMLRCSRSRRRSSPRESSMPRFNKFLLVACTSMHCMAVMAPSALSPLVALPQVSSCSIELLPFLDLIQNHRRCLRGNIGLYNHSYGEKQGDT